MNPIIHILHIENDPSDAELVQAILEKAGHMCRITRVQTCAEFNTVLQQNAPDVILADQRLPMCDGMAALKLAQELRPEIPFVFVSGTMGEEAVIEALTQGATDYVLKPNMVSLESAVKRALQAARNRLEHKRIAEWEVAERKRAEEKIFRSDQRLRLHREQSPLGFLEWDENFHAMEWNAACERIFGYTREEAIGRHAKDLILPVKARELVCGIYDSLMNQTGGRHSINENITKDGRTIICEWFNTTLLNKDGKAIGVASICNDITEQKRIEQALISRERDYRTLIETVPDLIVRYDLGLRRIYVNPAWEKASGLSAAEVIGVEHTDTPKVPSPAADEYVKRLRKAMDTGITEAVEFTWVNAHGVKLFLEYVIVPEYDHHGKITGVLSVGRDITARKKAEESVLKLSQAIEQSPVSIVITDADGSIEFVNTKFAQVTGYTYEEAVGENPRILKSGETPVEEYSRLWKTISSGGVWQGEFHNRKKDGELFWEHATIAPVRNEERAITHYVAVKEDITGRKKLEDQFRQAQKMEAIGQLAGGVAHDFNNMLGVIIGHAEMALEKEACDDSLRENLEEILAAGLRSTEITRQLLAFARKQTIMPKILNLNKTVEGMLRLLRRLIGEDLELLWLPGSNLWPVKMDPSQIDQILANLCVNARDAITGVGKVTIETQNVDLDNAYCAEHTGASPGEYVMLAVSDNGCGMDKPTMDKIFEPFFTTKGTGKGTGMGLATVYGIVKQNAGFINVYSEPEHGTTFKTYLPRHAVKTDRIRKRSDPAVTARGSETILLVEDDPLILNMVKHMLEKFGYFVLAASTPGEATRIANERSGKVALLLTDVVMPEMTGRDLEKRLTAICPELKCLFMSGYTGDVIAHHGILDEGVNFIEKPFSMQELGAKVREVLDSR